MEKTEEKHTQQQSTFNEEEYALIQLPRCAWSFRM